MLSQAESQSVLGESWISWSCRIEIVYYDRYIVMVIHICQKRCPWFIYLYIYMGVSENRGTPKSSILIGISIINHPFWGTPIFGNTHIWILYVDICTVLMLSSTYYSYSQNVCFMEAQSLYPFLSISLYLFLSCAIDTFDRPVHAYQYMFVDRPVHWYQKNMIWYDMIYNIHVHTHIYSIFNILFWNA